MSNLNNSTKTLLVVEDEPAISQICLRVLTGEGFGVDIAPSGDVAKAMLGEKNYDIVFVDIRTPGLNGMQLYQCICEEHPQLTKRVIFTTGEILEGDTMSFMKQSGQPFLPKPFTPDELRAVVREASGNIKN